ncbi:MAG: 50S ribosomal protein L33 [bacterium JZ-2024 1]
MAKKEKKKEVTLECSDCRNRNYITSKSANPRDKDKKLELKKYCPTCRRHTPHRETK